MSLNQEQNMIKELQEYRNSPLIAKILRLLSELENESSLPLEVLAELQYFTNHTDASVCATARRILQKHSPELVPQTRLHLSICDYCQVKEAKKGFTTKFRKFCSFGCFLRGNAEFNILFGVVIIFLDVISLILGLYLLTAILSVFSFGGTILIILGIIGLILRKTDLKRKPSPHETS